MPSFFKMSPPSPMKKHISKQINYTLGPETTETRLFTFSRTLCPSSKNFSTSASRPTTLPPCYFIGRVSHFGGLGPSRLVFILVGGSWRERGHCGKVFSGGPFGAGGPKEGETGGSKMARKWLEMTRNDFSHFSCVLASPPPLPRWSQRKLGNFAVQHNLPTNSCVLSVRADSDESPPPAPLPFTVSPVPRQQQSLLWGLEDWMCS